MSLAMDCASVSVVTGTAGHHRQARRDGMTPRFEFVADGAQLIDVGPDEDDAGAVTAFGERRILRKKTVTRMNRVDARLDGGGDDRVDVEIAAGGCRGTDAQRAVGEPRGHGIDIRFRCSEDGFDAEFTAGADDAHGDLAAIRDHEPANARHVTGCTRMST